MKAYHNDPQIKADIIAQLEDHRAADQLIKGQYWEDGKGCAVGCTLHSGNFAEYEPRFGIPQMLARLEDCIFEGLPNDEAMEWPVRFMAAIEPGADLSLIGWKLLHWLLTDEKVNPGINHPLVAAAVKQCADLMATLAKGEPVTAESAERAAWSAWSAESAERAAWSAARAAACAATAAWSAAESAETAAWSAAERAAESAESAESAETAAERAAWSAARAAACAATAAWSAAESAESAARAETAAWSLIADKLVFLISATTAEAAPTTGLVGTSGDTPPQDTPTPEPAAEPDPEVQG